jgi:hypothetical protein
MFIIDLSNRSRLVQLTMYRQIMNCCFKILCSVESSFCFAFIFFADYAKRLYTVGIALEGREAHICIRLNIVPVHISNSVRSEL